MQKLFSDFLVFKCVTQIYKTAEENARVAYDALA